MRLEATEPEETGATDRSDEPEARSDEPSTEESQETAASPTDELSDGTPLRLPSVLRLDDGSRGF